MTPVTNDVAVGMGLMELLQLQVKLGTSGVEEVRELGELNSVEQKGVDELIPILEGKINKGVEFAKTPNNEKL